MSIGEPLTASDAAHRQRYLDAMASTAAGVTVVTTAGSAGRHGLTASSTTSASADPPLLLVCVNHGALAHQAIQRNGHFCINVLSTQQTLISNVFAGFDDQRYPDRFTCAQWTTLTTGSPVLYNALAAFDCRVQQAIDVQSHTIFLGLVVAIAATPGQQPLLYTQRGYAQALPLAVD